MPKRVRRKATRKSAVVVSWLMAVSTEDGTVMVPVNGFHDASQKYETLRDLMNLGASDLSPGIILEDGRPIAKVSYNGKVWDLNEVLIYNPDASETKGKS